MMMNPAALTRLMNAKNQFAANHPKFSAFCKDVFSRGVGAGTVIEITVARPGEEPMTANMRILQKDLDLIQSLSDLAK